jgi:hypothetical protein
MCRQSTLATQALNESCVRVWIGLIWLNILSCEYGDDALTRIEVINFSRKVI